MGRQSRTRPTGLCKEGVYHTVAPEDRVRSAGFNPFGSHRCLRLAYRVNPLKGACIQGRNIAADLAPRMFVPNTKAHQSLSEGACPPRRSAGGCCSSTLRATEDSQGDTKLKAHGPYCAARTPPFLVPRLKLGNGPTSGICASLQGDASHHAGRGQALTEPQSTALCPSAFSSSSLGTRGAYAVVAPPFLVPRLRLATRVSEPGL